MQVPRAPLMSMAEGNENYTDTTLLHTTPYAVLLNHNLHKVIYYSYLLFLFLKS